MLKLASFKNFDYIFIVAATCSMSVYFAHNCVVYNLEKLT